MYTVTHRWPNPRLNATVDCETRREAIVEAKKMYSEEEQPGCSHLYGTDGKLLACRDWNKKRLSWASRGPRA
jgi:hypothetical protein